MIKRTIDEVSRDVYLSVEELTAPRELTNEPMVTTPSPVLVSLAVFSLSLSLSLPHCYGVTLIVLLEMGHLACKFATLSLLLTVA